MTTTDEVATQANAETAEARLPEAELLFPEARAHRRRRWLVSGVVLVVTAIIVALLVIVMTPGRGHGKPTAGGPRPPAPVPSAVAVNFSMRPVLCAAPAFAVPAGQAPSTGTLPPCSASSQWTESALAVNISTGQPTNFVAPDAQFLTYPTTSPPAIAPDATVLLPVAGDGATGSSGRFVLGPAAVTGAQVASAKASELQSGQWVVDLTLTSRGAVAWDDLAHEQFHAYIGVVLNGKVISSPITLATQSRFTSFDGHVQIAGSFGKSGAERLAASL